MKKVFFFRSKNMKREKNKRKWKLFFITAEMRILLSILLTIHERKFVNNINNIK